MLALLKNLFNKCIIINKGLSNKENERKNGCKTLVSIYIVCIPSFNFIIVDHHIHFRSKTLKVQLAEVPSVLGPLTI